MKNLMNSIDKINTVAGLSDPILSGCSPAENVQTPFRARRPANRQTGGPMPLGFDPPHPGGMGRQ